MATATRKCKVCGHEYEYCHTARHIAGTFRWQDVACSPEHGSIYLAKVIKSRSDDNTMSVMAEATPNDAPKIIDDTNEYDELFEEEFDDVEELAIETR